MLKVINETDIAPIILNVIDSRWLTVVEAAKYLGVSHEHFRKKVDLTPFDLHGKKIYDREELDAYVLAQARWQVREKHNRGKPARGAS